MVVDWPPFDKNSVQLTPTPFSLWQAPLPFTEQLTVVLPQVAVALQSRTGLPGAVILSRGFGLTKPCCFAAVRTGESPTTREARSQVQISGDSPVHLGVEHPPAAANFFKIEQSLSPLHPQSFRLELQMMAAAGSGFPALT